MSDGSDLILRASFKPTPSIFQEQLTVNSSKEEISMAIKGRHDPIIGPRAVVVVESMTAITILDLMMTGMSSKLDNMKKIYNS
jgi:chorismate synthase